MLEDGGFVITWHSQDQDGDDWGIFGQRFDSRVEIKSGLANGEMVVVEGWKKMAPGVPVIAAPESEQYGVTPGPIGSLQEDAVEAGAPEGSENGAV